VASALRCSVGGVQQVDQVAAGLFGGRHRLFSERKRGIFATELQFAIDVELWIFRMSSFHLWSIPS